jgi:hypothetical protein
MNGSRRSAHHRLVVSRTVHNRMPSSGFLPGSAFWFPSISISTGIKGHVAQHVTLAGDGGACPRPGHPNQGCEQIMLTTDGGRTYKVVKKINDGTSGNFNGCRVHVSRCLDSVGACLRSPVCSDGDLGTWVPPVKSNSTTRGEFQTIVGCNDCTNPGGSLTQPAFLQVSDQIYCNCTLCDQSPDIVCRRHGWTMAQPSD